MAGQTLRGRRPEGQTRPSVVRALRAKTRPSEVGGLRARQDPARSEARGPQQTQRGQRPEGQTRPSEVRALRAKQGPAWSKAQSGQSPKRPDRPSEVRALRVCEEQTRTCATARRPECQQASVPRNPTFPCLFSQAAGVTFQLPREGRRACLSVSCSLLLFSLLSFFRAGFPGVFLKQGVRGSHFGHPRG